MLIKEIFDKFDISKRGEINFELFSSFYKYIDNTMKEDEKTIFETYAVDCKIQNKELRNFFFNLAKTRGRVILLNTEIPLRHF